MADERAYIKLNSRPYRIILDTYRDRDISDFSPRSSIPGGGVVFSEMNLYQPLNQTDWRHGFGHPYHDDAAAYWETEGNVETRIPGVIQMGSRLAYVDTSTIVFYRVFEGKLGVYLAVDETNKGLYSFSQASTAYDAAVTLTALPFTGMLVKQVWTNGTYDFVLADDERLIRIVSLTPVVAAGTATGGAVGYLEDTAPGFTDDQYNGYLLQLTGGTGSGQIRWINDTVGASDQLQPTVNFSPAPDATTTYKIWDIHQAGTTTNSSDYHWMTSHDGYVFAGKDTTNHIHYASEDDLSDLEGMASDDPAMIKVGKPGYATLGAVSYNGNLIIFKNDGLYKLDADRTAARKILDYSDLGNDTTRIFTAWAVFNGTLVFGLHGRVYQWNGVRVSDITPPEILDTPPYTRYYHFRSFISLGNYLLCLAQSSGTRQDLICYDGVGWSKLCPSRTASAVYAQGADVRFSMVYRPSYYQLLITNWCAASQTLGRFWLGYSGLPDGVYTPLQNSGTNTWISSRFDAGFRRVQKSTPSILLTCQGITSTDYVEVYYRLNDGSWTAWGGTDHTTNKVTANGVTEFKNPLGATSATPPLSPGDPAGVSTIEYYWMQLKLAFTTDNTYSSPSVEDITVRLIMRPDTDYGFSFTIVAAKEAEDQMGATDTRDVKTMIDDLHTARDSKAPVDYIDPFGIAHKVYVSSISGTAVENHVDNVGPYPDLEHLINITLVEVTL